MSNSWGEVFSWDDQQERILWLSRHDPNQDQKDDLSSMWPDYTVTVMNMTYPVGSTEAVQEITETAQARGCSIVVAVLPAHIAAAAARRNEANKMALPIYVPVNRPVAASDDGKPRPFEHSHFEEC